MKKYSECHEVQNNDRHRVEKKWPSTQSINERHTSQRASHKDQASAKYCILSQLGLNSSILKYIVRVEENGGVYAAKLLRQLQHNSGYQRPAQSFKSKQLSERNGLARSRFVRLSSNPADLLVDLSVRAAMQEPEHEPRARLVVVFYEQSARSLGEEHEEEEAAEGGGQKRRGEKKMPASACAEQLTKAEELRDGNAMGYEHKLNGAGSAAQTHRADLGQVGRYYATAHATFGIICLN